MDSRLQKLQKLLHDQHLDAVIITSTPQIIYLTGYTGFLPEEREAYLFITKHNAYIFTTALYAEEIKKQIPFMTFVKINRDNSFIDAVEKLVREHTTQNIGIEEHNFTAGEYRQLQRLPLSIKGINLTSLRVIKTSEEITTIQKACQIGDRAFNHILKRIKPGVTEKKIAHDLDLFMKQQYADPSFRAIVAFGKNAATPHHVSGNDRLQNNTCILLDFGVKIDNYCSDMTRTIFVGKVTAKQKDVYQTVLQAQQQAITFLEEKLRNNHKLTGAEVDTVAREYILDKGYASFQHGLGHGIGLEIHEPPRLSPPSQESLLPGMVFSIEPGIYLVDQMGVRIEDLFTIHNNKLIQLTTASKELIVV